MDNLYPPIYYSDYLQFGKILSSRKLKSSEYMYPAHNGMLFIIVHKFCELWFKQILHELDSVIKMFQEDVVNEKEPGFYYSTKE